MEEKLHTPAQVAERLQVSERTVYRWIDSGELKAVKLGRLWRIQEPDLKDFLNKRSNLN